MNERRGADGGEFGLREQIDLQERFIVLLNREAEALGVDAGAAKHALDRDRPERLEEFLQSL